MHRAIHFASKKPPQVMRRLPSVDACANIAGPIVLRSEPRASWLNPHRPRPLSQQRRQMIRLRNIYRCLSSARAVQPRRLNGAADEHQRTFPSGRPDGEVEKRSRRTANSRETDDGDEERAEAERHCALMGLLMTLNESRSRRVEGDLEQSLLSYVQRSTESTNNFVLILDSNPCGTGISV
ncbi:hypothetical protein GB937_000399 [Aspergillus fischeri]|nr:hypothetical protein GB937_000399 [Aspergillus fischeri]